MLSTICENFKLIAQKLKSGRIFLFRESSVNQSVLFGLFWLAFYCFGSIKTQKLAVSVRNRNKHFVSVSAKTSFGSIFGCFESKLVSLDTLVTTKLKSVFHGGSTI